MVLVLMMLAGSPVDLKALRERMNAEGKKADLLWREGKYAEAVKVREALQAELEKKLAEVPVAEQKGAYMNTAVDVEKNTLAEWRPLAALGSEPASAAKLIIGLLNPKHIMFDAFKPGLADPQVVKLLAAARKDPAAAKVLGRGVKVTVTGDEAAQYTAAISAALKALGLGTGTEPFEVKLKKKGPYSAHLMGDDQDECTLSAVASWPAAGLKRVDVTAHGFGDETVDGDCLKQRVKESVALLAEQVLRTALKFPLVENPNKAEGL